MAEWKCVRCGWANSSKWTKCAKCGLERITEDEFQLLEIANEEIKQLNIQIEQHNISSVPKWEYLIINAWLDSDKKWKISYKGEIRPYNQMNKLFTELGNQGWELVSVSSSVGSEKPFMTTFTFTYTFGEQYFFKRLSAPLPEHLQKQFNQLMDGLSPRLRTFLSLLE